MPTRQRAQGRLRSALPTVFLLLAGNVPVMFQRESVEWTMEGAAT
jgi:hypothetical protein